MYLITLPRASLGGDARLHFTKPVSIPVSRIRIEQIMKKKFARFVSSLRENTDLANSLKQLGLLVGALVLFGLLTAYGVFTSTPDAVVPPDYRLKSLTSMELEDQLRAKSPAIEEVIFFPGLKNVAVVYPGFENHRLVSNADTKEIQRLAQSGGYKTTSIEPFTPPASLNGWWYLCAIVLGIRTLVVLLKKPEGWRFNRLQWMHHFVAAKTNDFIAQRNWRRSRFYLLVWLSAVAMLVTAANYRVFNREAIPSTPADYVKAARAPAWTIERQLQKSPEDFQRGVAIEQRNAVYVVLKTPENTKGERLVVERMVEFGEGEAGKIRFDKFVSELTSKKVSVRNVEPVFDNDWSKTLTSTGSASLVVLGLILVFSGLYMLGRWELWSKAEKNGPGASTPPITAGGDTPQEKPTPNYNDVDLNHDLGGVKIAAADKKMLADVAGCDEAVEKFRLVARWIKDATVYKHYGAKLPNGVLLYGPPGTGKTLLARALAGEVNGNYFYASGSEFINKYVGVGADNVRSLFARAKEAYIKTRKPSIVFIDELDAVGKHRSEGGGSGGEREHDQTVNQLLTCIQGFDPNNGTLVIAATNRPETLDSGLTRSGRFDYKVEVGRPDKRGRKAIFAVYLRNRQLEPGVNLDDVCEDLAKRAHDFVGADIELAVNEAATRAAERNAPALAGLCPKELAKKPKEITRSDLHAGVDQVKYGELIKSKVRSDKERRATAIHEIGHACVPTVLNGDPVSRITIVMTSKSLGLMESAPQEDRYGWSREQFLIRIKTMLAGRIAEEQIGGETSTGASNDFERASLLARQMVGIYGMSEQLGLISIPLNKAGFPASDIGADLVSEFNTAWRKIITDCETETRKLIEEHRACIIRTADALLEEETLTGDRFHEIWNQCPESRAAE
jgi:cell division protease FtsH